MSPNPSSKRPGILAWGLFALGAVVGVWVIINLIASFAPALERKEISIGARGGAIASGKASRGPVFSAKGGSAFGGEGMAPADTGAPAPLMTDQSRETAAAGMAKPSEQRIIKAGELELRVADAAKASEQTKTVVTGKNGYVEVI